MTVEHSTAPLAEPTPENDLPIWKHKASGQWAITRKGRRYYLGKDYGEAASKYLENQDRIQSGRPLLESDPEAVTIADVCNQFLTYQEKRVQSKELSPRTFNDYEKTAKRIAQFFGRGTAVLSLSPADFNDLRADIAKTRNVVGVGNEVTRVKTILSWASKQELIDRPPRFGTEFKRPPKRAILLHRKRLGKKLFTAEQVRLLLDEVGIHVRAMVLLGINCGFGNADCGNLPFDVVDLENSVIEWWRPKTGVARRCILWPETVSALTASGIRRPAPRDDEAQDKFFVTQEGLCWAKDDDTTNPISKRVTAALMRLKIHQKGMSFYWLRHTFRTVADETLDQPACNYIMGHSTGDIVETYRQRISDERLRAVTDHVRAWLFGEGAK